MHAYQLFMMAATVQGVVMSSFSAAWFSVMPAATLPFDYLYHVVTKNQIQLFVQGHRHSHIGKDILYTGHILPDRSDLFNCSTQ